MTKPPSAETRAKMSASQRGNTNAQRRAPVPAPRAGAVAANPLKWTQPNERTWQAIDGVRHRSVYTIRLRYGGEFVVTWYRSEFLLSRKLGEATTLAKAQALVEAHRPGNDTLIAEVPTR